MTTDTATLWAELHSEFIAARLDLLRAQIQVERRDSPENRAKLGAAVDEVDAVLDMWLDCKGDCE